MQQRHDRSPDLRPSPSSFNYISTFTALVAGRRHRRPERRAASAFKRRTPPLFMKPGDTIEVEITGIGTLTHPIAAE